MKRVFIKLSIIGMIIALAACQKLSDDTVAKVGKFDISVDDYKAELAKRFTKKDSYADVDSSMKMDVLNRMIEEKLYLNEAYDKDINDDPAIKDEYEKRKESIIGNKYYERNVVDKVIPEEKLREAFDKKKEEVHASHILIAYKGAMRSKATRSKDEAKKLADQIYKQVKAGKSFGMLAVKYSDDPSAKQNKGDLGFFGWGQMAGPFQEKAFSQKPGEISEPVLTPFGYHIIKTIEKRENPRYNADNFDKEKTRLKHELYRGVQPQAKAVWDSLTKDLKEKHDFKLNEENIKVINALIAEKLKKGKITIKDFDDSEKSTILASWDNDDCDWGYILGYYGARFSQYAKSLTDLEKLKDAVSNFSVNKMIVKEAIKDGYENDPSVQEDLENLKKNMQQKMIRKVENEMVNGEIEITDEDMQKYYEEHKDSFKNQAEIEMWEIYVTDKKLAEKILKQAKSGKNFEKLVEKYTEDKFYKKKKGYFGFVKSYSRGEVSKKALEAGSNSIIGPIKYRKGWVIAKTGLEKPERIKTFDEAKGLVRSKLRTEKMKTRKEEVQNELRDSYSVEINEKLIGKI